MSQVVKVFKNDALIKIEVGVGFIRKLQDILMYFVTSVNQDQMLEYKNLIENSKPFTEPWMDHLTTITSLINHIEEKAIEQNLTDDVEAPIQPES